MWSLCVRSLWEAENDSNTWTPEKVMEVNDTRPYVPWEKESEADADWQNKNRGGGESPNTFAARFHISGLQLTIVG